MFAAQPLTRETLVTIHRCCATAILLLSACGGGPAPVQPARSAPLRFKDSCRPWPTATWIRWPASGGPTNGPALKTQQPPDYEKRIAIMQAYLRNDGFHITSDVARSGDPSRGSSPDPAGDLHLDRPVRDGEHRRRLLADHLCRSRRCWESRPSLRRRCYRIQSAQEVAGELPVASPLLCFTQSARAGCRTVVLGWIKAIRRPAAPVRGISSIRR